MAIPPDIKIRLEQLRQEMAARAEAQLRQQQAQQNAEKMSKQFVPGKADGGLAHLAIGGQGPKNWLKGSIDRVIEPLKQDVIDDDKLAGILKASQNPKVTEASRQEMAGLHKDELHKRAVNNWVQSNLTNYIRKQMATHDDPIRKLAEQGIIHMPPEQMGYGSTQAEGVRKKMGAPRLGQSPEAQAWEDAADVAMHKTKVGNISKEGFLGKSRYEPWMEKADPNTELFYPTDSMHAHYLGFDHLVDVLKQDLAEGKIRPEQLSKVSIEQAVRRVHEYDQERKKAMAETALKATEGMPVHKDYGDGFKWIELTMPKNALPEGWQEVEINGKKWLKNEKGEYVHEDDDPREHKLKDALKYEGDTMGHCVGGYCPDVIEGRSRIFSLRDAKNEPHVTIEVNPHSQRVAPRHEEVLAEMKASGLDTANMAESDYDAAYEQALQRVKQNRPPAIRQIKGKQNAKPKKDYIPYVQDFVKNGNWSEIGDLGNAEMRDVHPESDLAKAMQQKGLQAPRYVTDNEMSGLLKEHNVGLYSWKKASGGTIEKAQGGAVNAFDYENPSHVSNVANIAAKHQDFSRVPDAAQHLGSMLSTGSYKFIEDPRIQHAIRQAGHSGYYINHKAGKERIVKKAIGGAVTPSLAQMRLAVASQSAPVSLKSIGLNEALDIDPKVYIPPAQSQSAMPAPGGVATPSGMPIGGIDMNKMTPGQQLNPLNQSPMLPDPTPKGSMPGAAPGALPSGFNPPSDQGGALAPTQPPGNDILQMTPQGRAMAAISSEFPPMPDQTPSNMAKGGTAKAKGVEEMKAELAGKKSKAKPAAASGAEDDEEPAPSKRLTIRAEGPGGVTGIVVPHHMWHGRSWVNKKGKKVVVPGMKDINEARAQVYGSENRDPLSIGKMGAIHKDTLAEHFKKPLKEQLAAESEATNRLRAAKHLGANANTLDKSEKLDTVNHEHDAHGRTYIGFASKGIAGHALYTSGHGENAKHHIINTCPGQTEGCGGGKSAEGIVDTSKGTCFAPNAESQYVHAAVRRATHEQAKHDPAMTRDWILAHTGSIRKAAEAGDKHNKVLLFRPNVVDETDVSSRHVIRHLNDQRKASGKPTIEANSYGKTNELHDPENGYHVTHSNVGPKVKKGREITENIGRDRARVRNTIMAADNRGDFKNEQGHKTPPKGSYLVTDVKRNSKLSKDMEGAITHAKYWSTGRKEHELSEEEKKEGPEGHYSGTGRKTTEDKAHYGHKTIGGERFDYQRQHILHPRLVQVGLNKDGTPHMIPTDSRFKDTEFLPKNRFKTKNGKDAGHILMTTPTESTSNLGHETSFTHHVNQSHIEHAKKNNGEYEIDKPEEQIKARGKEYAAPQPMIRMAEGGAVGRHPGYGEDDFHAFPERNLAAQRHLAMRRGDDEERGAYHRGGKKPVAIHKDLDTMRLALTRK